MKKKTKKNLLKEDTEKYEKMNSHNYHNDINDIYELFEDEVLDSNLTYLASEESLAKTWLSDEEDKAWQHLQKNK